VLDGPKDRATHFCPWHFSFFRRSLAKTSAALGERLSHYFPRRLVAATCGPKFAGWCGAASLDVYSCSLAPVRAYILTPQKGKEQKLINFYLLKLEGNCHDVKIKRKASTIIILLITAAKLGTLVKHCL
jgi:hypothetical protein